MKSFASLKFIERLTAILLIGAFFLPAMPTRATTASDYQQQLDTQTRIAQQARSAAAQKAQQAAQVQAQINIVNSQIDSTQSAIDNTNQQISSTNSKIADLTNQITTQEKNLADQQDRLSKVVASWYMEGESGLVETVIGANNLSSIIDEQQYYESIRQQIQNQMDQISQLKAQLNQQKADQQNQLATLGDLKNTQIEQQSSLEAQKSVKNSLLTNTTQAMNDLNNQAAQAEAKAAEIRQILARIYSSGRGTPSGNSLFSSVDGGWYYNQRNYSTVLSPSKLTIAEVGCLVTSYAMVATKMTGRTVTPPNVVAASAFNTSGSWLWFNSSIGVTWNSKVSVNWDKVNYELSHGRPVIVSVRIPGTDYDYNGDGSNHWIVIKGFSGGHYLIHDPYWTNSSYSISDVKSMKILQSY